MTQADAMFDTGNHLAMDNGALDLREHTNDGIISYTLIDLRGRNTCPGMEKPAQLQSPLSVAQQHRNLRPWDGFGIDPLQVDSDSAMRHDSALTRPRQKLQLPNRVFHAVPNLAHGNPAPDAESKMMGGLDTSLQRLPGRLAEANWNRFDPVLQTVDVKHIIPPWVLGGQPSREIARSDQFLQQIGYVHDGKVWRRRTP